MVRLSKFKASQDQVSFSNNSPGPLRVFTTLGYQDSDKEQCFTIYLLKLMPHYQSLGNCTP